MASTQQIHNTQENRSIERKFSTHSNWMPKNVGEINESKEGAFDYLRVGTGKEAITKGANKGWGEDGLRV